MSGIKTEPPEKCSVCGENVLPNGRCQKGHSNLVSITVAGYDHFQAEVKKHSKSAGKVYIPKDWRNVLVIRLDEPKGE